MDKEKSKRSVIDTNLLNGAVTRGLSEVYRVKLVREKKDKIRAVYGSVVIKSAIFGTDNPKKEALLEELRNVDLAHPHIETDYLKAEENDN